MDLVKKVWPAPFKVKKGEATSLIIQLVIFLIVLAIAGFVLGLLSNIPIAGIIFSVISSLMGIYSFAGIILCILKFIGSVK